MTNDLWNGRLDAAQHGQTESLPVAGLLGTDRPGPQAMARQRLLATTSPDLADRLLVTDCCFLWTGGADRMGYGRVSVRDQTSALVHRIVYQRAFGDIGDLTVDHLCYVRRCVRLEHLEPVTLSVNSRRAVERRRQAAAGSAAGVTPGGCCADAEQAVHAAWRESIDALLAEQERARKEEDAVEAALVAAVTACRDGSARPLDTLGALGVPSVVLVPFQHPTRPSQRNHVIYLARPTKDDLRILASEAGMAAVRAALAQDGRSRRRPGPHVIEVGSSRDRHLDPLAALPPAPPYGRTAREHEPAAATAPAGSPGPDSRPASDQRLATGLAVPARPPAPAQAAERAWATVTEGAETGCLVTSHRSGRVQVALRSYRIADLLWERWHGPLPSGHVVVRACRTRRCVSPVHAFVGTPSEIGRRQAIGQHWRPQTTAPGTPSQA